MDTKTCEYCGATMRRKEGQQLNSWRIARFCNRSCAGKARFLDDFTPAPRQPERTCECGKPTTQVAHFYNLMYRNYHDVLIAQALDLCEDCYEMMMQEDRGAW